MAGHALLDRPHAHSASRGTAAYVLSAVPVLAENNSEHIARQPKHRSAVVTPYELPQAVDDAQGPRTAGLPGTDRPADRTGTRLCGLGSRVRTFRTRRAPSLTDSESTPANRRC